MLREMEFVTAQMHTRMGIVSQYMGLSVALAGGMIAAIAASEIMRASDLVFLALPLPFFLFGFLILREDVLTVSHDAYWHRLRAEILKVTPFSNQRVALGFLDSMTDTKLKGGNAILGAIRYGPALLPAFASLFFFFVFADPQWSRGVVVRASLLSINGITMLLLLGGMLFVFLKHKKVAALVSRGISLG